MTSEIEGLKAIAERAPQQDWQAHGTRVIAPFADTKAVCNIAVRRSLDEAERIARPIATCDPPTVLSLLAEIERLRGALKPFAARAAYYDRGRVTFGPAPGSNDFRAAREALASKDTPS